MSEHTERFIGDETRWEYDETRTERTCRWCGAAKQRLTKKERIVVDEEWENDNA